MLSIPTDLGSHVLLDTCKIAIHITYTNSSLLFWSRENVIQKGGYCHDSPSCPFPSGVRVLNAPLRTTSSTILLARSTKMLWSPVSLSRPKHRIQTIKRATLRIRGNVSPTYNCPIPRARYPERIALNLPAQPPAQTRKPYAIGRVLRFVRALSAHTEAGYKGSFVLGFA